MTGRGKPIFSNSSNRGAGGRNSTPNMNGNDRQGQGANGGGTSANNTDVMSPNNMFKQFHPSNIIKGKGKGDFDGKGKGDFEGSKWAQVPEDMAVQLSSLTSAIAQLQQHSTVMSERFEELKKEVQASNSDEVWKQSIASAFEGYLKQGSFQRSNKLLETHKAQLDEALAEVLAHMNERSKALMDHLRSENLQSWDSNMAESISEQLKAKALETHEQLCEKLKDSIAVEHQQHASFNTHAECIVTDMGKIKEEQLKAMNSFNDSIDGVKNAFVDALNGGSLAQVIGDRIESSVCQNLEQISKKQFEDLKGELEDNKEKIMNAVVQVLQQQPQIDENSLAEVVASLINDQMQLILTSSKNKQSNQPSSELLMVLDNLLNQTVEQDLPQKQFFISLYLQEHCKKLQVIIQLGTFANKDAIEEVKIEFLKPFDEPEIILEETAEGYSKEIYELYEDYSTKMVEKYNEKDVKTKDKKRVLETMYNRFRVELIKIKDRMRKEETSRIVRPMDLMITEMFKEICSKYQKTKKEEVVAVDSDDEIMLPVIDFGESSDEDKKPFTSEAKGKGKGGSESSDGRERNQENEDKKSPKKLLADKIKTRKAKLKGKHNPGTGEFSSGLVARSKKRENEFDEIFSNAAMFSSNEFVHGGDMQRILKDRHRAMYRTNNLFRGMPESVMSGTRDHIVGERVFQYETFADGYSVEKKHQHDMKVFQQCYLSPANIDSLASSFKEVKGRGMSCINREFIQKMNFNEDLSITNADWRDFIARADHEVSIEKAGNFIDVVASKCTVGVGEHQDTDHECSSPQEEFVCRLGRLGMMCKPTDLLDLNVYDIYKNEDFKGLFGLCGDEPCWLPVHLRKEAQMTVLMGEVFIPRSLLVHLLIEGPQKPILSHVDWMGWDDESIGPCFHQLRVTMALSVFLGGVLYSSPDAVLGLLNAKDAVMMKEVPGFDTAWEAYNDGRLFTGLKFLAEGLSIPPRKVLQLAHVVKKYERSLKEYQGIEGNNFIMDLNELMEVSFNHTLHNEIFRRCGHDMWSKDLNFLIDLGRSKQSYFRLYLDLAECQSEEEEEDMDFDLFDSYDRNSEKNKKLVASSASNSRRGSIVCESVTSVNTVKRENEFGKVIDYESESEMRHFTEEELDPEELKFLKSWDDSELAKSSACDEDLFRNKRSSIQGEEKEEKETFSNGVVMLDFMSGRIPDNQVAEWCRQFASGLSRRGDKKGGKVRADDNKYAFANLDEANKTLFDGSDAKNEEQFFNFLVADTRDQPAMLADYKGMNLSEVRLAMANLGYFSLQVWLSSCFLQNGSNFQDETKAKRSNLKTAARSVLSLLDIETSTDDLESDTITLSRMALVHSFPASTLVLSSIKRMDTANAKRDALSRISPTVMLVGLLMVYACDLKWWKNEENRYVEEVSMDETKFMTAFTAHHKNFWTKRGGTLQISASDAKNSFVELMGQEMIDPLMSSLYWWCFNDDEINKHFGSPLDAGTMKLLKEYDSSDIFGQSQWGSVGKMKN